MIETLTRNAVDILPAGGLERKLKLGRPLRVKFGIDVTAPDVHIGNAIPLQRMRAFQDAGHLGVLIIGDYTTRIGDPSGRSVERPILSPEEIDRNAQTYLAQAGKVIDLDRTEVRFNGEWLGALDFAEVVRITRTLTVAQLLERDDFAKRFAAREPISVSELLYPLMQGYDSVAVNADVELGGTDQLYNLLAGRALQEAYGQEPQIVLTTPLLLGFDGQKMSASRRNYVGLAEPPEEQFGKTMRLSDELLSDYYRLVLQDDLPAVEPMEAKLALARWIVARSYGEGAATLAEAHFTRVVREGQAPDDVPAVALPEGDPVHLPALLAAAFGLSTSEARRLIGQGGLKVDGVAVTDLDVPRADLVDATLQAGKRRFAKLRQTA
ncbi:MAG: tyrosine--tRNA ligase [Actinobacteria bacterium]|nr:tyrosine--tRNA ligase [Actinomycetota bacterium]